MKSAKSASPAQTTPSAKRRRGERRRATGRALAQVCGSGKRPASAREGSRGAGKRMPCARVPGRASCARLQASPTSGSEGGTWSLMRRPDVRGLLAAALRRGLCPRRETKPCWTNPWASPPKSCSCRCPLSTARLVGGLLLRRLPLSNVIDMCRVSAQRRLTQVYWVILFPLPRDMGFAWRHRRMLARVPAEDLGNRPGGRSRKIAVRVRDGHPSVPVLRLQPLVPLGSNSEHLAINLCLYSSELGPRPL